MVKNLICIGCPLGCELEVKLDDNGSIETIKGNTCKRGETYAIKEVTKPERTVTSTVKLIGGEHPVVAVKTERDIPKDKIFDVMEKINSASANAPVNIGDVIIENVCSTGVNVVATANSKKI